MSETCMEVYENNVYERTLDEFDRENAFGRDPVFTNYTSPGRQK